MFNRRTDSLANAIRLLTALGGIAARPDLLGKLGAGTSAYDALKKLAERPPEGLATLADSLTREAEPVFAGFRDAPPDAAILYEQMVAASLLTPQEIVGEGMDAAAVTDRMLSKLTDPDHRRTRAGPRPPARQQGLRRRPHPRLHAAAPDGHGGDANQPSGGPRPISGGP